MRLSIFPEANAHPKGKDEKIKESFKVSYPYVPETIEISDENDLIKYVTKYAWSPFVFDGVRREENFVSCDLLVYDIDDSLTIDGAEDIVKANGLCCLCLPSPSHTPELNKFRLILPLAFSIKNIELYRETWKVGANLFKVVDEQCKDSCRFYFGSTMDDGFWNEGKLFEPVEAKVEFSIPVYARSHTLMLPVSSDIKAFVTEIYGEERTKIPESVEFFIKNASTGLPGQWNTSLNSFCFSLALSGVHEDIIFEVCEKLAPDELDKKDIYQINRSIKDGKASKEIL